MSAPVDAPIPPPGEPLGDRRVVEVSAADTHDLRRRVLRVGTPTTEVRFAEDELDGTFHLAVETLNGRRAGSGDDDRRALVAISTWVPRCHPDHPAVAGIQLRGMATDPTVRGTGCGALVLRAGLDRARELGAGLVWARARDSALDFYLAHDFVTFGPGYTDLGTALPHHDVIHHLSPA